MTAGKRSTLRAAYFDVEVLVAITLMGIIAALTADALFKFGRTGEEYRWRRAASWAAYAQLERLQAGAAQDSLPPPGVLPAEIRIETRTRPATGVWKDFQLVTVTATAAMPSGRTAHESCSGFVRENQP